VPDAAASDALLHLDAAVFAEAHRALLADRAIQFDLPMRPELQPPGWLSWLLDFLSTDHPAMRLSLWVVAALLAVAIAALVAMRLKGRDWPWRHGAAADSAEPDWRPEEAQARELLGEADALAAAGRFSEAAHLLLHRSIADVDERRPDLVRKSLTSREVAALLCAPVGARAPVPAKAGSAFARIAMLVERAFFARTDLGEPEWRTCRAAYEEFAFADAWR
jgi:hypothetical protein